MKQLFGKQRNQRKNSPWCPCENMEHRSWGLEEAPPHSNDGWYLLPWEVRKEGPLEEDDILMQRKDEFENGFYQKWVCSKSAEEHKDLKNIEGGEWRKVEKLRKVFFFFWEKKWWGEEEKSSGKRRWIVLVVEERGGRRKQKRKKGDKKRRGPKSAPTLKTQQVAESTQSIRTYVFHLLGTYVTTLCNWLILWQNALYLYLGRFRMYLNISRNHVSKSSVEAFKSVQENKLIVQVH